MCTTQPHTRTPFHKEKSVLRTPVESSNIKAIAYDNPTKVLEVEFSSGAVYRYDAVPLPVWREFMRRKTSGESIGRYFNSNVKGTYKFRKVSE
jgi:hypothetical protein